MIHDLKCSKPYFEAVATGIKRFELRLNDRNYKVGDLLRLKEYCSFCQDYTGRSVIVSVLYILNLSEFQGNTDNMIIMSISL
jgi:ASC-1-like (ASCH) protein